MHQADFPVWRGQGWGGVGTKYLRYRQQNKCGVINFHESRIGGEVISLGCEASLLASSTGSRSQRANVFRRAGQKTIRTVELQCSRALLPSSLFAAARLRPLEMLKHTLSTCCSFAGRCFLCTATHSDLFLQPGYLFNVLFKPVGQCWAHVCPVRMCELPVFFFSTNVMFFSSFFSLLFLPALNLLETSAVPTLRGRASTWNTRRLSWAEKTALEILFTLISGPLLCRILFMPSIQTL